MKRKIDPFDYTADIFAALKRGILLTTKADDQVNTMTISWGFLGIEFNKPIFITVVRKSRYTMQLLEKNPEFTINIPIGIPDRDALRICGTKSFRDMDKIKECGLTLEKPEIISVPGIREFPLTLECRIIYAQKQEGAFMPDEVRRQNFPAELGEGDNFHKAYYGEIVSSYIIE